MRLPASAPHQALLLPDAAILSDQSQKLVMVVGADGTAHKKAVQLGIQDGEDVILKPGELVHINQSYFYQLANETDGVTVVPWVNLAEQLLPQLIEVPNSPFGVPVTVPFPPRPMDRLNTFCSRLRAKSC